jgi:hypothetical protein
MRNYSNLYRVNVYLSSSGLWDCGNVEKEFQKCNNYLEN